MTIRIHTTLNIDIRVLNEINQSASILGKTRTKIIIRLLKKVMHDSHKYICYGSPIKYQPRSAPQLWHKFHIKLKSNEYEYFLDLRKILKASVSSILAYAVKRYLPDMTRGKDNNNDPYCGYIIDWKAINGIQCWKLIWGNTKNISTHYRPLQI